MNGFDVVRGGTGGGVFLYATRHDEPAVMEVGRTENARDRLGGERDTVKRKKKQVSHNIQEEPPSRSWRQKCSNSLQPAAHTG